MEPPWEGGTKVCINGPGHMTKMAATPIYGKNPSKIFSSWYLASGTHAHHMCSNGESGVILTYLTARSNLVGFSMEKVKTVDFSETFTACDMKVGRCRQLIEFMKVCEY